MSRVTDEQIAEWRALADKASSGPWRAVTTGVRGGDHWYVCDSDQSIASIHASDGEDEDQRQPDAEFIAAARQAIPALLTALVEAERERDELKARIASDQLGIILASHSFEYERCNWMCPCGWTALPGEYDEALIAHADHVAEVIRSALDGGVS